MSFLQIPGNIKQQFAPFVIDPNSPLLSHYNSSTDLEGNISPQYFTFRQSEGLATSKSYATLQFYPSSLDDLSINDDISFKLLYENSNFENKTQKQSLTIRNVLDHLPAVQIREFLPDTRLDQCINMFVDLFSNMAKLFSKDDSSGSNAGDKQPTDRDKEQAFFKKLLNTSWYTMKYMVGATDPDFFDDLSFGNLPGLPFSSYKPEVYQDNRIYPGSFVMAFPYVMYYKLQSCVTTNIYEIPAIDGEKRVLNSGGGMQGWTDGGDDFMSAGGFRLSGLLGKIPLIGSMLNMILGNIGINYMPWWNAESGAKTKEPALQLTFHLFNDSYKAAMWNFIFVNTIVPNNKWIQYNMFQHSSSLYDVKIEGLNRLFACAGDINVSYEGVLRDPPNAFIDELFKKHANRNVMSDQFKANMLNNKLIKIPDVYKVTLNFQSLLPANFNNYIFNYAENAGHMVNYSDHVYDQSKIAEMLPNAMARFGARVAAVWNSGAKDETEAEAAGAAADVPQQAEAKPTDTKAEQQAQSSQQQSTQQTATSNANAAKDNRRGGTIIVR